jgi:hypothetical protein
MPDNRILHPLKTLAAFFSMLFFSIGIISAQTNQPAATGAYSQMQTNDPVALMHLSEAIRGECINNRRQICGRIIQMFTNGIVVESGYTNLLRDPLTRSWLVRGSVEVDGTKKLLESTEPGAVCVGRVFVTDLPKSRGAKPVRYDYVIFDAYPTGEYTYTSIGDVHHTVRKFSGNLNKAVDADVQAALSHPTSTAPAK